MSHMSTLVILMFHVPGTNIKYNILVFVKGLMDHQ
jgi:hypothetical protein